MGAGEGGAPDIFGKIPYNLRHEYAKTSPCIKLKHFYVKEANRYFEILADSQNFNENRKE